MRISRHYTTDGQSAYDALEFRITSSEIRNPDGSVVFKLDELEVPKRYSQVASDVLAQKYFRKAGVPARLKAVEENTVPAWLWRKEPDEKALAELPEDERYIGETSAKQHERPGAARVVIAQKIVAEACPRHHDPAAHRLGAALLAGKRVRKRVGE